MWSSQKSATFKERTTHICVHWFLLSELFVGKGSEGKVHAFPGDVHRAYSCYVGGSAP